MPSLPEQELLGALESLENINRPSSAACSSPRLFAHVETPVNSNSEQPHMARSRRFWSRAPTHPIIEITRLDFSSDVTDDDIQLAGRPATAESDVKTVIDHETGPVDWSKGKPKTGVFTDPDEKGAYRELLYRLDIVILPLTALLYLSAYLNRGNLGNASLLGLRADALDDKDLNYSLVLCSFFFTYILLSVPGTLLSKVILPSTTMSIAVLVWGVASTLMAACQTYWQMMLCRAFIGVGEALFGQSVVLYYSLWYRRGEISKRMALFIGSAVVAGAFGGLIAYGVGHIKTNFQNWRILFLIEGGPSVLLSILCLKFLPSKPDRSTYLTKEQSLLLQTRMNEEWSNEGPLVEEVGIDWEGVREAFKDPKIYVSSLIYSCLNLGLASVSGFLPRIIASLGFSTVVSQLLTVPPYAVAFAVMIPTAAASDYTGLRGPFVVFVFACSSVGWALLLLTADQHIAIKYTATFFIVIGGYCAIPLMLSWVANNCSSQSKRATALGMLNTFGQMLSVAASFLFPASTAPGWTVGCAINLSAGLIAGTLAGLLSTYYAHHRKHYSSSTGFEYIS